MSIVAWLIVGLIAGIIANLIYPGPSKGGVFGAIVLGILGAIVGGWIFGVISGQDMMTGIDPLSIVVAVIGALVLLVIYNAVARPRTI